MLRRLKALYGQEAGPFTGMADNLGRMWSRVVKFAGADHISIHDMRRTYCTRLLRSGTPVSVVQKLSGHRNPMTLLRYYAGVSDEDKREAVKRLQRGVG